MIRIQFQDAATGQDIDMVTHPAVPRVGEIVILSDFYGTVASVVWQWWAKDTPCCYVALREVT